MIAPATEKLVQVSECLEALGYSRGNAERTLLLIKKYKIEVVAETPFARGVMRMMRKSQMDELVKKHTRTNQLVRTSRPHEASGGDPQLHIFRLEEQVKALNAKIDGMNQTFELFQKSSNLMADRLNKVLEQLGAHV